MRSRLTFSFAIDCERLLLPFGRYGKVEQLLGSLQLKSSQEGVQRTKVLGDFQLQADVLFSGKIASGFSKALGVDPAADGQMDVFEFRSVQSAGRPFDPSFDL